MLSADFITNRDQMCVYATESVGWILIIAICGDLFALLARASESQCCGLALLLRSSSTVLPESQCSLVNRMGWPYRQDSAFLLSVLHLNWSSTTCISLACTPVIIPISLHLYLYPSLPKDKGRHELAWGCCDMAQPLQSPWSFCPTQEGGQLSCHRLS